MEMNNQTNIPSGIACPQCGKYLEFNIKEILDGKTIECPNCHYRLVIDRSNSRPAFESLQKIEKARRELEERGKTGNK